VEPKFSFEENDNFYICCRYTEYYSFALLATGLWICVYEGYDGQDVCVDASAKDNQGFY
jgi:hypothetical protein